MSHNPLIARLRTQIDGPRDGALLRFSLGHALIAEDDFAEAARELRAALEFDVSYTAAWKLLGLALKNVGDVTAAADAWRKGIEVAGAKGDVQAGKEMRVFLRRLEKAAG